MRADSVLEEVADSLEFCVFGDEVAIGDGIAELVFGDGFSELALYAAANRGPEIILLRSYD